MMDLVAEDQTPSVVLLLIMAGREPMCISASRQRVFHDVSGRTSISKELPTTGPYLNSKWSGGIKPGYRSIAQEGIALV